MSSNCFLISSVVCSIILRQSRFGRWASGVHCASWHLLQKVLAPLRPGQYPGNDREKYPKKSFTPAPDSCSGTHRSEGLLFFLKKLYKKGSAFSFFVDLLYWEWKFPQYGNLKKIVPLFHFLTDYYIGNENSEIR